MVNLGKKGEEIAVEYLKKEGYEIVETNYRHGRNEIDIISKMGDLLVFVEVKARSNLQYGFPESFVSKKQEKRITQTAEHYIFENNWEQNIRFDVISIETTKGPRITHFKDAIIPYD